MNKIKRGMVALAMTGATVSGAMAQGVIADANIQDAVDAVSSTIADCVIGVGLLAVAGLVIWGILFAVRRGKSAASAGAGR